MEKHPKTDRTPPVPDEVLDSVIDIASAYAAGRHPSEAEAVFYLYATPALLRELRDLRQKTVTARPAQSCVVVPLAPHIAANLTATPGDAA